MYTVPPTWESQGAFCCWIYFFFSVPAPVCPTAPTSSGGVITIRWNYTHTGGLELTRVIVTATKGSFTSDVSNGNLTDPSQTYLNISTFTAGFSYIFTVTAYNQLGSSSVQCDSVRHLIGMCLFVSDCMCHYLFLFLHQVFFPTKDGWVPKS